MSNNSNPLLYKRVFLLYTLLYLSISYSQCKIENLMPFILGESKFDSSSKMHRIDKIEQEKNEMTDVYASYNNGWRTYEYLKNDSIYRNTSIIYVKPDECFGGRKNIIYLNYADNVLYKSTIIMEYDKDMYSDMEEKMYQMADIFREIYPYEKTHKIVSGPLDEKIGEGISYFSETENKRSPNKPKRCSIDYTIKYKSVYDRSKKVFVKTSDIDYYEIEILFVDLKGTKLTNEGY